MDGYEFTTKHVLGHGVTVAGKNYLWIRNSEMLPLPSVIVDIGDYNQTQNPPLKEQFRKTIKSKNMIIAVCFSGTIMDSWLPRFSDNGGKFIVARGQNGGYIGLDGVIAALRLALIEKPNKDEMPYMLQYFCKKYNEWSRNPGAGLVINSDGYVTFSPSGLDGVFNVEQH